MSRNDDTEAPKLDPVTADSEEEDVDFASEHERPTVTSEPQHERSGESAPTDHGGMDMGSDTPP